MSERQFAEAVIRFRWLIIFLTLMACFSAGYGVQFITISTEPRDNFGPDNPQLQAFEDLEETFTRVENLLFAIQPKEGDIFTREVLAVIEDLTEETWRTSSVNRVDSITNYQHTEADGDDLIVSNLVEFPAQLTDEDLDRIRNIALNEPLVVNRLVSKDGRIAGINIDLHLEEGEKDQNIVKAHWAWDKKAELMEKYPNLDVYATGSVIISSSFSETAVRDMTTQTPMMYVFVIIVLGLLLRSVTGVVGIVVTTLMTMAAGMGMIGWFEMSIATSASSIPVIILTVVIAHGVHLMVSYYHELRDGVPKYEAIIHAVEINIQPVFLTSLSTAIGFFSLNLMADQPPIQQLGNIVGTTVCFALVTSLTFLPALVYVMPNRVQEKPSITADIMGQFAEFVIANRTRLLISSSTVAVVLVCLAPLNVVSDQFSKYFSEELPIRTDTDFTDENLGGLYRIEYSLDAGISQGISNPEYLKTIDEFAEWYRSQEHVAHVSTYTDIIKQLNQTLHGGDETFYRLPETQELSAQYLLLYELSLPLGLDLTNMLSFDKSASRFIVSLPSLQTFRFIELQERGRAWLEEHAPNLAQEGSSLSLMFTHIGKRAMIGGVKGASVALVLIAIALIFAFRSVKMGLISIVPNLLPGATGFGVWYLLSGEIGMSLSMVLSITMGIVVDDTVHFLSKYLRARKTQSAEDAVRYAFRSVGVALWVTTLVLVVGFLTLASSDFKLNSDMGTLVSIVIAIALVFDFILLPPLLIQLNAGESEYQANTA
ncbi:MAG: MMPL family transporter [Gammaproteobacteria bacterium]|nr:MMPL family transporter [Gammaproteobacteria bacterium]MBT4492092.1 MMPL family transporter [Gammaproteobacteria bacterium]